MQVYTKLDDYTVAFIVSQNALNMNHFDSTKYPGLSWQEAVVKYQLDLFNFTWRELKR